MHTRCKYEIRKRKGGDERKQTLDTRIYLVVSVGTKSPLVHVVEAPERVLLPGHQVSSGTPLNLPQWLGH
jgi:hypothetical protein